MAPALTSKGACAATGGTWSGGVVAIATGTCDSAWHRKHSDEVSVGVVNFRSTTATCTGSIAVCGWHVVVQSICVRSATLMWQLAHPNAWISPAAIGNWGWLKLAAGPPVGWHVRHDAVSGAKPEIPECRVAMPSTDSLWQGVQLFCAKSWAKGLSVLGAPWQVRQLARKWLEGGSSMNHWL